jgi:hypothetical protein
MVFLAALALSLVVDTRRLAASDPAIAQWMGKQNRDFGNI